MRRTQLYKIIFVIGFCARFFLASGRFFNDFINKSFFCQLISGRHTGLHCGKVITTEFGGSKSEIAYHGDTINTTARIRSTCHDFNRRLLISAELLSHFPDLDENYKIESKGVCLLKWKQNVIALFSVEEKIMF